MLGSPVVHSSTVHDRTTAIGKNEPPRTRGVCAGKATSRAGAGEKVESEGKVSWDEKDDVVLFLWENTPAGKEHHRKKSSGDYSAYGGVERKCASGFSLTSL